LLWTAVVVVLAGIILVIVLCVKGSKDSNSSGPHPAQDLQLAIIDRRPRGDPRTYQYTVLPNGLQVVNVQDGLSKTSAYAMAVRAGSFDDPKEFPGLAHFCEHMLFLGTESYPDASSYDNFVSSNAGYLNAYTAEETTVYYTELSQSAAGEGLKRFADFFHAPLFAEEYAEREVHAIDSEHAKNVQDPSWRINQLLNSLANPSSPVAGFHTGNKETLLDTPRKQNLSTVDALHGWFREHYCPSRYHLVTYGPEPLSQQLERVYEDFSGIYAGSTRCQEIRKSWMWPMAWMQSNLGHWANIQGTQPQSELIVFFPLPDMSKEYLSQPLQYIEYSMTYGGINGFVKTVRDTLGLASSIGVSAESSSAGTSIYFSCRLAQPGHDNPTLVLDLLFQYLHILRAEGIDEELQQSLANVTKIAWDWAQAKGPSETASDLAERMTRLPARRLLSGDDIIEEPDSNLVYSLLTELKPTRMNVGFIDPDAKNNAFTGQNVLTDPYYGTKYTLSKVADKIPEAMGRWHRWEAMQPSEVAVEVAELLAVANIPDVAVPMPPGPIRGISADFPLDHMQADKVVDSTDIDQQLFGVRPERIQDLQEGLEEGLEDGKDAAGFRSPSKRRHKSRSLSSSTREAWFRAGWVNPSPKVQMQFLLRPRIIPTTFEEPEEVSATSALRLGFYTSLLAEELVPQLFNLTVAGASFDISLGLQGGGGTLSIAFEGFPPLLPNLIQHAVQKFGVGLKMEEHKQRYDRIFEEYEETFLDYSNMPVDYALSDRNLLLTPGTHSQEESLDALVNVTPESVESAVDQLVTHRPLDMTALIMGNTDIQEAEDAVDWVMEGLQGVQSSIGHPEGQVQNMPPVVRPAQPLELRKRNPREGDTNDAIVVSILAGIATVESRVILGLVGQILSVLAYNDLRTERQLGYVVSSGVGQMSNVQYISTIVQGETARADDMEVAVERVYFKLMPERLRNLTNEEFDTYKDSFRQQLLQPPSGRSEEFGHYWSHIMNYGECFGLLNEMLDFMDQNLTSKASLQEAWERIIFPRAQEMRKKVVVKYFAGEVVPPRPHPNEFATGLLKAGFDMEIRERLSTEYAGTQVLDAANSTARINIAKQGGYYPTLLHCKRMTSKADGKEEDSKEVKRGVEGVPTTGSSLIATNASIAKRPANATLPWPPVRGHRPGRGFLEPES